MEDGTQSIITNEVVKDADDKVISEDVTLATSTRLPILRLADNDDYAEHTCEGFVPQRA